MKRIGFIAGFAGAISVLQAASGQVISAPPGISVFPFAGVAAGQPPLLGPEFGLIDVPGGPHGGDMLVATEHFQDVMRIDPTGTAFPYTEPFGTMPSGACGIDVDGPTANLPGWTWGWYGGASMTFVAAHGRDWRPATITVFAGGRWELGPSFLTSDNRVGQLQIDRTGWYSGYMYVAAPGGLTGGIVVVDPYGDARMWAQLPYLNASYFTFGPGGLWASSGSTGAVFSISPAGEIRIDPPLAVLEPGLGGLAFGPGDAYFGTGLYACNLTLGHIDIIAPDGTVTPFARGLDAPAYPMFVTQGPFARNGQATLYVICRNDVWMFLHCRADVNDDSLVDFADYLMFLNLFDAGDPRVDYTGDGLVDFGDYLQFLNFYDAGC